VQVQAPTVRVPDAAARRLSNQIERAFRGTYGARTGLRTIVQMVTRQMLGGGASRDSIAQAMEQCVLNHPARQVGDPRNVVTGEHQSGMLVDLTRKCVEETVV
jgi:hypothetical protein